MRLIQGLQVKGEENGVVLTRTANTIKASFVSLLYLALLMTYII